MKAAEGYFRPSKYGSKKVTTTDYTLIGGHTIDILTGGATFASLVDDGLPAGINALTWHGISDAQPAGEKIYARGNFSTVRLSAGSIQCEGMLHELVFTGKTWYVRPSGGTYGDEDGTSYANAWDGFTNLDWTVAGVQPGDRLYICGTHTETFVVGGSGTAPIGYSKGSPITILGNYPGDAGVINSEDTRNTGLDCNIKNYITISSLTSIDAVNDCFQFRGTSTGIITYNLVATGSGNQGIQHEDTASVTHYNPTCTGNVDDGLSGHDFSRIRVIDGTFSNNADGINVVADCHCTVTGTTTFSGNSLYDIWAASATTNESCWIDITGAALVNVRVTVGGKVILTNCTASGNVLIANATGTGYMIANNCIFPGHVSFNADAISSITDSMFTGTCSFGTGQTEVDLTRCLVTSITGQAYGIINLSKCYVKDNNVYNEYLNAEYTLFEGGIDHICDIDNGCVATFKYCVFDGIASGKFGIGIRAGCTATIEGCTFVSASKVGKGVFSNNGDVIINNCIFTDLATGIHQTAGTIVSNNGVFYDNTNNTVGTVTENDSQYGDPKLVDVPNNDFSLGAGSSAIDNGKDLGSDLDEGIDSATWGNGTTESPTGTTKKQGINWDIGAYIS